jgi:hypothetical protein
MAPITWADSANRHDITREDAVHAIVNSLYFLPKFDQGRTGGIEPDLYISVLGETGEC